jgi:hypothetical protein
MAYNRRASAEGNSAGRIRCKKRKSADRVSDSATVARLIDIAPAYREGVKQAMVPSTYLQMQIISSF